MTTQSIEGALPPLPANLPHVVRRIRACESEVPAQVVFEHALHAYAAPLLARVAELENALRVVLPMAKGYAHTYPVGSNQAYCDQADAALAAHKEQQ